MKVMFHLHDELKSSLTEKYLMLFSQNPTDANIFLPQCPMSEYNASAPVVHQNTKA
jgi:hypothetical protein